MFKLERLAYGIAEVEGFYSSFNPKYPGGSRAYRNHNPGNLRSSPFQVGTLDAFAVFKSDEIGFFALKWDLLNKALGKTTTGLGPNSTLTDLIKKWAPVSDNNDPAGYLQKLVGFSGLPASTKLKELLE